MNNYVLFSLVGSSDPIRGFYDGPMIHICRVYKPRKVYLLYTTEMYENDILDNRYERAVKEQIDKNIEVVKIKTKINEPHKFETFFVPIKENIDKIREENPEDEILVNITSGTAQFIGALTMFINYTSYNVKPVQVTTPSKSANISEPVKKEYELEDIMELNQDNVEGFIDRTIEPDLSYYNRLMVKSQLKKLVESYQYKGGIELLKTYSRNYHKVSTLLRFADMRMKLTGSEINDKLNIFENKEIKEIKYAFDKRVPEWYSLIEYYNVLKTKSDIGDYALYVIMLEPLSIKIYEIVLKQILRIDPKSLFSYYRGRYKIDPGKMDNNLKNYIENKMNKRLDNRYVSDIVWIETINFYFEKTNKKEFQDDFEKLSRQMNKVKKNLRNHVAHSLKSVSKNDFEKIVGTSPEIINSGIELFIKNHLKTKDYKHYMLKIYERINDKIFELIDEEI